MPHIRAGYADLGLAPGKRQRTNDDIDNAMWLIWLLVIIGAAFGGIVDWPAKEVVTPIIGPAGGRLIFGHQVLQHRDW